jgi:hypothetical protein
MKLVPLSIVKLERLHDGYLFDIGWKPLYRYFNFSQPAQSRYPLFDPTKEMAANRCTQNTGHKTGRISAEG